MDVLRSVLLKLLFYYRLFCVFLEVNPLLKLFFATKVNRPRCWGDYHVNIYQHAKYLSSLKNHEKISAIKKISNIM